MSTREYRTNPSLRLETFSSGFHSQYVSPTDLAQTGFIYSGSQDIVICVFCNTQIGGWEQGDTPESEHVRIKPDCPGININWVQRDEVGCLGPAVPASLSPSHRSWDIDPFMNRLPNNNSPARSAAIADDGISNSTTRGTIVADDGCLDIPPLNVQIQNSLITDDGFHQINATSGYSFSPGYRYEPVSSPVSSPVSMSEDAYNDCAMRVRSFTRAWPWLNHPRLSASEMAKSGFYYSGDGDKVKCFLCCIELNNWETSDTPFGEHERWRPECPLVQQLKKQQQQSPSRSQFPCGVASRSRQDSLVSDSEVVQSMQQGFEKMDLNEIPTPPADIPETTCVVCFESRRAMAFIPCGHVVCCEDCGNRLTDCALCRKNIQNRFKVFLSM